MEIKVVEGGKIMVDGKETSAEDLQKRYEELDRGSMLQADYTKKTQEIADERRKVAELETALKDKEASLADIQELAQALTSNPEMEAEVKKIAAKYTKGGSAPTEGSQADTAMKAELKKLADKITAMEQKEQELSIRENYNTATSAISSAIDAVGVELTEDQKDVLQKDAWMYSMSEHAKTQKLPDKETLNKYIEDKVKKVFPMAKKMSDLKNARNYHQPVGDATGAGGVMTSPDQIPRLGSKEYAEYHKKLGSSIAERFGLARKK